MNCKQCQAPITRQSKTGMCKSCALHLRNHDPEFQARRIAKVKEAFAARPELGESNRAKIIAINKTPEARQRASHRMQTLRLWEIGQASLTPQSRERAARTLEEKRLGHIPKELRGEYRHLVNNVRCSADEACAIILAQHEKNMAEFRRKLGAA